MEKEIGTLSESVKYAHKRIDNLEKVVDVVYDLSSNVKVFAERMESMNNTINKMQIDMEEYHQKEPNKLIFNVKNAIILAFVGAIIGAIITLIIK